MKEESETYLVSNTALSYLERALLNQYSPETLGQTREGHWQGVAGLQPHPGRASRAARGGARGDRRREDGRVLPGEGGRELLHAVSVQVQRDEHVHKQHEGVRHHSGLPVRGRRDAELR